MSTGFNFGSNPNPGFGTGSITFGTPAAPNQQTQQFGFGNLASSAPTLFGTQTAPTNTLGFNKPATFGTPTNNPPAFGLGTPNTGFGAAATQNTSFGFGTNTANPGLTFGTPASSAPTFGSNAPTFGTGTSFGTPAASTGLSFGTPATSASTGLTFGTPAASTGLAFGSAAPTFGTPATASTGLSFGTPTVSTGLSFGSPAVSTGFGGAPAASGPSFGTPATTAGLSFGTAPVSTGLGFGAAPATTGLGFGTPATSSGLGFGTSTASTGLSFGTATTSSTLGTPAVSTGLSFGTPAPSTGLSFGNAVTSTGFGLSTSTASTGLNFNPTPSTNAPSTGGLGLNFGTTTTTTPSLGLSFGTTTTSTVSTGLKFGLGSTAPSTALSLTTPAVTTQQNVGLGGIATTVSKSGSAATQKEVPPRDQLLPNEFSQLVDQFKSFIQTEKGRSSEVSRDSVKELFTVEAELDELNQQFNQQEIMLQNNRRLAEKLKFDTAKGLQHTEMAQRTQDTPPNLQYENTAPLHFFLELADQFEHEMQSLKLKIDNTEKFMKRCNKPTTLTSQDLTLGMRRLHETFVALAGRMYTIHSQVENQRELYTNLYRRLTKTNANPFEKLERNVDNLQVIMRNATTRNLPSLSAGPSPFTGLNMSSNMMATQQTLPPSFYTPNPTTMALGAAPSVFGATSNSMFNSTGFGPPQTSLFNASSSFQLQKPPAGNKRGKQ